MSNENVNGRAVNLEYVYAGIDLDTGLCHSVLTTSYVIDNPAWILVPALTNDYRDKYYNVNDGKWYLDQNFESEWLDAPQW